MIDGSAAATIGCTPAGQQTRTKPAPLRSAPKVVAVDWLAFYQTGAFGEEKWRIQYVAEVRGHELTTRQELLRDEPDHPRAREEYFKIQIGPLNPLANPIPAGKWLVHPFVVE